ncbi:putative calcium-binding outer membrane-like protein, partial [Vibrio parahaemolyticus V-223/04]
KPPKQ